MGEVAGGGRTVLFVSHNLAAIQSLCHRAFLFMSGTLRNQGTAGEVVEQYLAQAQQATSLAERFPVFNDAYGIGLSGCTAELEGGAGRRVGLVIRVGIRSDSSRRDVGVGFKITSGSGVLVTRVAPKATHYTLNVRPGEQWCEFRVEDVTFYVAGGDYIVGVWLAIPNVEVLARVDEAAVVAIPARDVYGSGVFFDGQRFGVVPLKASFSAVEFTPRSKEVCF